MFNTLFIFFAAAAAEEKPNEQHVFRLEFNKIKTKRKEQKKKQFSTLILNQDKKLIETIIIERARSKHVHFF